MCLLLFVDNFVCFLNHPESYSAHSSRTGDDANSQKARFPDFGSNPFSGFADPSSRRNFYGLYAFSLPFDAFAPHPRLASLFTPSRVHRLRIRKCPRLFGGAEESRISEVPAAAPFRHSKRPRRRASLRLPPLAARPLAREAPAENSSSSDGKRRSPGELRSSGCRRDPCAQPGALQWAGLGFQRSGLLGIDFQKAGRSRARFFGVAYRLLRLHEPERRASRLHSCRGYFRSVRRLRTSRQLLAGSCPFRALDGRCRRERQALRCDVAARVRPCIEVLEARLPSSCSPGRRRRGQRRSQEGRHGLRSCEHM